MYADRADEIISSHNSSKPLFLMVAFQVQSEHAGHFGYILYPGYFGSYIYFLFCDHDTIVQK